MSTRSVIGWADTNQGRYVHFDGYPSGVGIELVKIIQRDGVNVAMRTITQEHYSWSSINTERYELGDSRDDGRFESVPGYGIAYTDIVFENGFQQTDKDDWRYLSEGDYGYGVSQDGIIDVYHHGHYVDSIDAFSDKAINDMSWAELKA